MDSDVNKSEDRPRLRLVANAEPVPTRSTPLLPSLNSAPFRPGELPLTAWVPLDRSTRELVWEQAKEAALPTELWVRIAVEASRLVSEISSLTGQARSVVIARLDLAASTPAGEEHLGGSELRRYAIALRKGHPPSETGEVLALRLPEEISGAWNTAASDARLEIAHWVSAALEKAPQKCVTWEAAAAATCRSLGEWAYASWLQASASARA